MSKLIGIAGPSCSGKTQLARWLSQELGARAPFRDYGNDVLFVCRQRAQGEVAR